MRVDRKPEEAFAPIQRIGGSTGWYAANWFWRVRGVLDTLRGGVGLRRGRRDPLELRIGDTVDFWRVERLESGHLLRLAAEMKIPGRLWLQFEVDPAGQDSAWFVRRPSLTRSDTSGSPTGICSTPSTTASSADAARHTTRHPRRFGRDAEHGLR